MNKTSTLRGGERKAQIPAGDETGHEGEERVKKRSEDLRISGIDGKEERS